MGKTAKVTLTLILAGVFCLSAGVTSDAATVSDLYGMYNVSISDSVPSDVKDTVRAYNDAQVYAMKYKGISSTYTDYSSLEREIEEYEERLDELSIQLASGYELELNQILGIESEIKYCAKQIDELKLAMKEFQIDVPDIDAGDLPDMEEYRRAKGILESSLAYELGAISELDLPVTGTADIVQSSQRYTVIAVPSTASVLSVFNGTVSDVDGDYVRISHGDETATEYYGLDSVSVSVGEVVRQGDRLGTVRQQFQLSLSLNGSSQDASRLFKGDA